MELFSKLDITHPVLKSRCFWMHLKLINDCVPKFKMLFYIMLIFSGNHHRSIALSVFT